MLKTYEESYFPIMKNYMKEKDLICERKSKGVFKFIPKAPYSDEYKFIVHVYDSYTTPQNPICVNVQVQCSSRSKQTSFWAEREEINFINALYDFFDQYKNIIKEEENL